MLFCVHRQELMNSAGSNASYFELTTTMETCACSFSLRLAPFAAFAKLLYQGVKSRSISVQPLLHIVPFCEGPNKKPEGFAKQKQFVIFAM